MRHIRDYEIRSDDPAEDVGNDDPIAAATAAVDELRTSVATFRTETDTRLTTELRSVTDRLAGIETRLNRPGTGAPARTDEHPIERRAFTNFLRRGAERLTDVEQRALIVGDDSKGGYLAPSEFSLEIIKNIIQFSPVRQAARVGATTAGSVLIPRRTGTPTAAWVDENEDRLGTQAAYGQAMIPICEAACFVDVSIKLLEDAAQNVEGEVSMDLAEEFGRLEGVAFVSGDGVKKPSGFMAEPIVASVPSGSATVIADADGTADGLINMFYTLKPYYRGRATWMMNGSTLAAVRRLKTSSKEYIWQPGIAAGQPDTILGRPVIEAVDMPDIAAGTYPVALGDFGSAYRIYDRVQMSVMRDPFTQATRGLVRFHARRRVGDGVVLPEAIKKLKIAVS